MCLNLSDFQLKTDGCIPRILYMNFMVTTKEIPVKQMHKKQRQGYKHNIKESHQLTRGERKRRRKGQKRTTETTREQQNGNKYIPINDYFKCKWNKCSE